MLSKGVICVLNSVSLKTAHEINIVLDINKNETFNINVQTESKDTIFELGAGILFGLNII